eukprot:m.108742 g.108742  ORF g.108742 m.108742 type:complete len:82 (+) comp12819_c0_seq4:182-427(+)
MHGQVDLRGIAWLAHVQKGLPTTQLPVRSAHLESGRVVRVMRLCTTRKNAAKLLTLEKPHETRTSGECERQCKRNPDETHD